MASLPRFRIFVSSPSDLGPEREVCERVIRRVGARWASVATVEPLMWEQEPLRMDASFQDQIPLPSEADVVVTMLWTRLGKRLHSRFKEAEDPEALTGTLFELRNALRGRETSPAKTPDVLVYRKMAPPVLPPIHEREKFKKAVEAFEEVEAFFESKYFQDQVEGSFLGAYHTFQGPEEFERNLTEHLRKLLETRLGDPEASSAPAEIAAPVRWSGGSPYRGLQFFDFEHADIFFGRGAAVLKLQEQLAARAAAGIAFVLLIGQSGSGKSSLVRAGLLPALTQPGIVPGVGVWRRVVLRPADAEGRLIEHFAAVLERGEAGAGVGLPELGKTPGELGKTLRQAARSGAAAIGATLREIAGALAAETVQRWSEERALRASQGDWANAAELERLIAQAAPAEARLIVFIDQLEELFTDPAITSAERESFIGLLAALAESGHTWITATLRSDFFPRCEELPELARLKAGEGTLHLLPPQSGEVAAMIRAPAEAAGLKFEKRPQHGEELDARLLADALKETLSLPLLEFTLDALYQRRDEKTQVLTFAAYEALGGLAGALAQRADEVYAELSGTIPDFSAAFSNVLSHLIGLPPGSAPVSRVLPAGRLAEGSAEARIVQGLIQARLLVADEGAIRVAHERLLQWPRAAEWIQANRAFLLARDRVQLAANRWLDAGSPEDLLLPGGVALAEAEEARASRRVSFEPEEINFIEASAARVRRLAEEGEAKEQAERARERRQTRRIITSISLGALAAAVLAIVSAIQYRKAQAASVQADRRRIFAESTAARASDERDAKALLAGGLMSQLRGKVSPELFGDFRNYVFSEIDSAQLDPENPNAAHARADALDTKGLIELQSGDFDAAQKLYSEALALRESAGKDQNSSDHQHDLVASYDNLGDVHAARAEAADPAGKDGLAAKEQAEAQKFYQLSLEMTRQLVATDPANGNWQNDLAVSFGKLGGLYFDRNDFPAAASQYSEGLAVAEKLLARDPVLPKWQALRAFFLGNLGRTALRTGDFATARTKLTEARNILSNLVTQKKLRAEQAGWLEDFEADIASLPPS